MHCIHYLLKSGEFKLLFLSNSALPILPSQLPLTTVWPLTHTWLLHHLEVPRHLHHLHFLIHFAISIFIPLLPSSFAISIFIPSLPGAGDSPSSPSKFLLPVIYLIHHRHLPPSTFQDNRSSDMPVSRSQDPSIDPNQIGNSQVFFTWVSSPPSFLHSLFSLSGFCAEWKNQ